MQQNKQTTLSIGDTAKLTGVTQKQIRHWEARGYIPPAPRVTCGERAYRRFTNRQIETIRKIKGHLDQGFTLAIAALKVGGKAIRKEEAANE